MRKDDHQHAQFTVTIRENSFTSVRSITRIFRIAANIRYRIPSNYKFKKRWRLVYIQRLICSLFGFYQFNTDDYYTTRHKQHAEQPGRFQQTANIMSTANNANFSNVEISTRNVRISTSNIRELHYTAIGQQARNMSTTHAKSLLRLNSSRNKNYSCKVVTTFKS